MDSPFRPGFGKNPPYLAGREAALTQLEDGLELGQWPQERGMLLTGLRGVGKTVLLNHAEDLARSRGWVVISETATQDFFDRITGVHLPRILNELDPKNSFRVTSVGLAGLGSIGVEYTDGRTEAPSFRAMCEQVCTLLEGVGGLLFTLDEVNRAALGAIERFAAEYQHLVRADCEVAFIGAGVQGEVRGLLSSSSATFLRRCAPVSLGLLTPSETLEAFRTPIRDAGRSVSSEVLDYMVRASQGYPFLVQQIGDIAWRRHPAAPGVELEDVEFAYRRARRSMGSFILEPSLSGLSATDRGFLAAMVHDDQASRMQDVRRRMGNVNSGYAAMYRQRLIEAGVIVPAGYGKVTITLPYLREFLREHVVADAASDGTREHEGFPSPPELDLD